MFLSYFIIVITGGRGGGRVAVYGMSYIRFYNYNIIAHFCHFNMIAEMICSNNVCLRYIISFIRWLPVIFILALLCWAYFAYVVQLCFCKFPSLFVNYSSILKFNIWQSSYGCRRKSFNLVLHHFKLCFLISTTLSKTRSSLVKFFWNGNCRLKETKKKRHVYVFVLSLELNSVSHVPLYFYCVQLR